MDAESRRKFNEEITRYRNKLISHAKECDWDAFKQLAGRLFDYVETIEAFEIRRRFLASFRIILLVIVVIALYLFSPDPASLLDIPRLKRAMIATGIGGVCYEVFFYMNYRYYISSKAMFYDRRKIRFIKGIEHDFRNEWTPQEARRRTAACHVMNRVPHLAGKNHGS